VTVDITKYTDPTVSSTPVVIRDVPLTVTECPVCGRRIGLMERRDVVCHRWRDA
jgi:hypothetical protein